MGTYVRASKDMLYSHIPARYRPYGRPVWGAPVGQTVPLAVRLKDGDLLANGARLQWPMNGHQSNVLQSLEKSHSRFGVVPFHSVLAAWTQGKERDWSQAPIPIRDLKRHVRVVVPSGGERWQEVSEKDKLGRTHTRQVHTLGDSVIQVQERFYLSAVDPTGVGRGMYFLAELFCDRAPTTLEEAFDFLKPKVVQEAEARGTSVMRQGEWFAVASKRLTSELMGDVERGLAVYGQRHVLGRDGHHELEEAVIYHVGPRKGEVYARGVVKHTEGDHHDLDLGTVRWYLIVHNIQGASYTLQGVAQFD